MLVRSGTEGDWLPLRPIDGLPEGGVRTMCGPDVGAMLELDEALPVVAWGPWPGNAAAGIDAVCVTADGGVELVVATHGEDPRDTLWRVVDVASSLQGTTLEAFMEHCTELEGGTDIAAWLHRRCGADGDRAVAHLRRALADGEFGLVLLTPDGAPMLAQPLALLARAATRIRTFTVQVLRAGHVYAVDATLDPSAASVHAAAPVAAASAPAPAAAADRVPTRRPEPAPDASEPHETAPEPEPEPPIQEAPADDFDELEIRVTDEVAFLAGVDRLDHRTSAHLRWLHGALGSLVEAVEYTTDGELVHVTGWCDRDRRLPLYGLDSHGLLQLALTTLPAGEQAEFAAEVAALLPHGADGDALLADGFAEVDVPTCLGDQTLLEYLVDNLVEALPGGREAFGTQPSSTGADYFDGVSASIDTAELEELTRRDAA